MQRFFPLLLCLLCLLFTGLVAGASQAQREEVRRLSELSGTVTGFDDEDTQLLGVNTRLGAKSFRVTSTTIYLLNNHDADAGDVLVGDAVTVTYRFDTGEARIVHLFRETQAEVRVVSIGNNVLNVELDGAALALRTNTSSVIQLAGVPISDPAVLVGRTVSAIYEPGTLTLLSLSGRAPTGSARLERVDVEGRRIVLGGAQPRTFRLHEAATIRRGNAVVGLEALKKGDRVTLVLNKRRAPVKVIAVQATRGRR